jgi:hypothetical protein
MATHVKISTSTTIGQTSVSPGRMISQLEAPAAIVAITAAISGRCFVNEISWSVRIDTSKFMVRSSSYRSTLPCCAPRFAVLGVTEFDTT